MTTYFRAWVNENARIITLCSSQNPLVQNTYDGPCAFAVDGEIDGEFMDALSVMEKLTVKGQVLSGLPILAQTILPGVAGEATAPIIPDLTFAQMLIGLVAAGWITEAEGDAWSDGTLPLAVTLLIASLPADHRFAAKVRAKRPSVILRSDPLVNALAATQGRTPAQMDAFFTTYAAI